MRVQVQDIMNIQMKYSKIIAQSGSNKKFSLLIFLFLDLDPLEEHLEKTVKM